MATVMRPQLRLACPNFQEEERASLRSLLGLLTPYLRPAWELVDDEKADLCLLRLDGDQAPPPVASRRWRGCALHPRTFGSGTLHRPVRAAELLALLNEVASETTEPLPASASATSPYVRLRLLGWPLDFEEGPRARVQLLAALTAAPCSMDDLAQCLRIPRDGVCRWVDELRSQGLVRCEPSTSQQPVVPQVASGWFGLVSRIGRKLGFGT
jgi:hypothetical protein